MSIEERIAEIVVDHHPDPTTDGETCMCGWDPARHLSADTYEQHVARVITTELELAQEFVARHESGGGYIRNTQTEAEQDLLHYRPPGVEDPGSGRCTHIEARYVTPWENA